MGYLKNKPGSLEAASATAIGMPEARTPAQQQTHDKMMKDFLAKGGKIQKVPAGKKTDPNKLKKGIKEDAEHFGISGIETQRPIDEQESKGKVIAKAPGDAASKTGDVETLKQQIGVLRQKLENEKQKAVKPQPNKDTGEVPLTIGVAYKHLKDKKEKEEESKDKKENKKIQTKNKADKQVQEEEVELDEAMPGGANSSSKKGAVWKAWKAAQRKRRKKLNNSALPRQLKDKKKRNYGF